MNAATSGVDNLDLERLNDADKSELRQFLANEQQRSQIQTRSYSSKPIQSIHTHKTPQPYSQV